MENIIFNFVIVETNCFGEDSIYSQHRTIDLAESRFNKDFSGTVGVLNHKIVHYDDLIDF